MTALPNKIWITKENYRVNKSFWQYVWLIPSHTKCAERVKDSKP